MSVFTTPMFTVEAPPLVPYQAGLLVAAPIVEHDTGGMVPFDRDRPGDGHWLTGMRWRPESTAAIELFDIFNGGTFNVTQTSPAAGGLNVLGSAKPFAVAVREIDSAFGWFEENYIDRATRRLAVVETLGVESQVETGSLIATNPHLADPVAATTLNSGNRVAPRDALAMLDEAIAKAKIGMGMIHAPAYLAAQWITLNQLEPADDDPNAPQIAKPLKFMSPGGNIIVAGNGYIGVGPDGTGGQGDAAHTFSWAYATDMMVIHRSRQTIIEPDTFEHAFDRVNNTVAYRAMRPYGVVWSRLLLAAVKVNTSTPTV